MTSIDVLADENWLAVIVFNHTVRTLISAASVRDVRSATGREACASIVAKGGTEFLPALEEAHRVAIAMPVATRKVVLLTDAHGPTEGVSEALESLSSEGIAVGGVLLPASRPGDPLRALLLARPGVVEVEAGAASQAIREALGR